MAAHNKPVLITGIGLLSCLGEGAQHHHDALMSGASGTIDTERFAPYPVHALGEVDWSQQVT